MATPTTEEFNAKIEETVGHLGVAIVTVARRQNDDDVRTAWTTFGRSLAELMDMEPPR